MELKIKTVTNGWIVSLGTLEIAVVNQSLLRGIVTLFMSEPSKLYNYYRDLQNEKAKK